MKDSDMDQKTGFCNLCYKTVPLTDIRATSLFKRLSENCVREGRELQKCNEVLKTNFKMRCYEKAFACNTPNGGITKVEKEITAAIATYAKTWPQLMSLRKALSNEQCCLL